VNSRYGVADKGWRFERVVAAEPSDDPLCGFVLLGFKEIAKSLKLVEDYEIRPDFFDGAGRQRVSQMRNQLEFVEFPLLAARAEFRDKLFVGRKVEFLTHRSGEGLSQSTFGCLFPLLADARCPVDGGAPLEHIFTPLIEEPRPNTLHQCMH
jgi:hypothetical protein